MLSGEQRQLLFPKDATTSTSLQNGVITSCKLCSAERTIKRGHHQLHASKVIELNDGTRVVGCKLDTNECPSKTKDAKERYHFHCPRCISFCTMKTSRLKDHAQKCGSDNVKKPASKKRSAKTPIVPKPETSGTSVDKPAFTTLIRCVYCTHTKKLINRSRMNRHLAEVHNVDPGLSGTYVDPNKGLYIIATGKSGSQKPCHVQYKTFSIESVASCSKSTCRDLAKIARVNGSGCFTCKHLKSAESSLPSTLPPLLNSELSALSVSQSLGVGLVNLMNFAMADSSPVVVMMGDDLEKNFLYFSVFEPSKNYYSPFGRVICTFDRLNCSFSCDCHKKSKCLHRYVVTAYMKQLKPDLVVKPVSFSEVVAERFNDKDTINEQTSVGDPVDVRSHVPNHERLSERISGLADYLYEFKKVPFVIQKKSEIEKTSFSPKETVCHLCTEPLMEYPVTQKGSCINNNFNDKCRVPIRVFNKTCEKCDTDYRYQEWEEGWHNFNNHTFISIALLEDLLSHIRRKMSLKDYVDMLNENIEDTPSHHLYNYDIINECFNHYLSLKDFPFGFCCGICGPSPNILVFDADQKVCIDVKQKDRCEELPGRDYKNYAEFHADVCKEDIVRGLTSDKAIINKYKLKLTKGWMPYLGRDLVKPEQPQTTRVDASSNSKIRNPHPLLIDRLNEISEKSGGMALINEICESLKISNLSSLNKKQKIGKIINGDLCSDMVRKKFFAIVGKTGGILRGTCVHGCIYCVKFLVQAEGVTDYTQCFLSFKEECVPVVLAIDFAPQVVAHTNSVKDQFFFPYGGALGDPGNQTVIDAVNTGEKLSLPDLDFSLDGPRKRRVGVIDKFHEKNHTSPKDKLHYIGTCSELDSSFDNSSVLEQQNRLMNHFKSSVNQKKADRMIKEMLYVFEMGNIDKNKTNRLKAEPELGFSLNQDSFTGHFLSDNHTKFQKGIPPVPETAPLADRHSANAPEPPSPKMEVPPSSPTANPPLPEYTPTPSLSNKYETDTTIQNRKLVLQNPGNLCWLTSIINLFTYSGISDDIWRSRMKFDVTVRDFFAMLHCRYNRKVHLDFAAYILKCLTKTCSGISNPRRYTLGETQDSGDILSAVIFPMILDKTDIKYHIDAMTNSLRFGCSSDLLEEFKEVTKTCSSPPEFVFVQVSRDIFPAAHDGKGPIPYQLSLESFTSITLTIKTDSHCFILEGFIVFSGHINDGHYMSYVREGEKFLSTSAHGRTEIKEDVFLRAAQAMSTTLLYMQQASDKDNLQNSSTPKGSLPPVTDLDDGQIPKRQATKKRAMMDKNKIKKIHVKKADNTRSTHDDYYSFHNDDSPAPPSKKPKHRDQTEALWLKANHKFSRTFDMTHADRERLVDAHRWFNDIIIDNYCLFVYSFVKKRKILFTYQTIIECQNHPQEVKGFVVQIVRVRGDHWVLITNMTSRERHQFVVYDTKAHLINPLDDKSLIRTIYKIQPSTKSVVVIETEKQDDDVNCGPYCCFYFWCIANLLKPSDHKPFPLMIRDKMRLSFLQGTMLRLDGGDFQFQRRAEKELYKVTLETG